MQGRGREMRRGRAGGVPDALILEIFMRLPVKTLMRFMCLSNFWSKAIASFQFFELHLHHSKQFNQEFLIQIGQNQAVFEPSWSIIASYNGVLCLLSPYSQIAPYHGVTILNPSIRKLKHLLLPPPPAEFNFFSDPAHMYKHIQYVDFGFGFDSPTNDFKIVMRKIYEFKSCKWIQVQVYSLRNNSWTILSSRPNPHRIYHFCCHGVINGSPHWVVRKIYGNCCIGFLILRFDFSDETFKEITLPACFNEIGFTLDKELVGLGEFRGKLSLLVHCYDYESIVMGNVSFEMWVMMENSVWVKQLVVQAGLGIEVGVEVGLSRLPFWMGMNDEVVLLITEGKSGRHLLSYDLKTLTLSDLGVPAGIPCRAFTYTPSLVFLGEENQLFEAFESYDLYPIIKWESHI